MTGSTATRTVSVDLAGRNELRLVVTDAGDGGASDHADWADAKLVCGSVETTTTGAS
jgi:beta-galactosidase